MRRAILAAVLGLAGCGSPMTQPYILLAATPTTYAVELYGDLVIDGPLGGRAERFQRAVEDAEKHCAAHGRTARIVSEGAASFIDRRRIMFACAVAP